VISLDQTSRIIEDVKREKQRDDKIFKGVTFEVRTEQVIMFFNYEEIVDTQNQDQYFIKHNHDPEFIDIQELNALKKSLDELHIAYSERRDDFM
jgi:membrane protease subunit (stomatin/prohibitin family)